jgi:hypothetical protein
LCFVADTTDCNSLVRFKSTTRVRAQQRKFVPCCDLVPELFERERHRVLSFQRKQRDHSPNATMRE